MPPAKKRKTIHESEVQDRPDDAPLENSVADKSQESQRVEKEAEIEASRDSQPNPSAVDKDQERRERFKALQARAVSLLRLNLSEC